MPSLHRLLTTIVPVRKEESRTLLLMFLYSFLAMTAYNIVRPLARGQFIDDLGADNLPYVQLATGVLIGVVMQIYTRVIGRLPRTAIIPVTLAAMAGLLVAFRLLFESDSTWPSILLYFVGLILGLLLISQFWTLANDIYDARQAKRLFGFIGGGASLGGIAGSGFVTLAVERIRPDNLLLAGAGVLLVSAAVVTYVIRTAGLDPARLAAFEAQDGVGPRQALSLLRESAQLQVIALIIAFAAVGAGLLEQQLNMAVEEQSGGEGVAGMAAFLAQVQLYVSAAGFVIQIWLTSRIHRHFGIGFALLILPVFLGVTSTIVLATGALWAAALGRTLDASLRYTIDKTTREILFLPLSADLKYRAKPFIDVTVDRFAKAVGASVMLVLIKPWGFGLTWRHLGVMGLALTGAWLVGAVYARRGYLSAFRKTIVDQAVAPAELRIDSADLSTVETLVEELAHPDESRVLYAIDLLESLDKRHLVTPLLLHHVSPAVRARALAAVRAARPDIAARWVPRIRELIGDEHSDVRVAALAALAASENADAAALARTLLHESDPRIVVTAAVALASGDDPADRRTAEQALAAVATGARAAGSEVRRDIAAAIRLVCDSSSRDLLLPLLHDPDTRVVEEALRSVQSFTPPDVLFLPALVALLGHRRLKGAARDALTRYGEEAVDALGHFLRDPGENLWVRRHIPATLARIPSQRSMNVLVGALDESDGFLRFKVLVAIEKLRREQHALTFARARIEQLAHREALKYCNWLSLHYNLFVKARLASDTVLARLLEEKMARASDRLYRVLGVLYSWDDVAAARHAIEYGDATSRAGALEYLDNVFSADLRHRVLLVLEDMPLEEKVQRGNSMLRTRIRDVEETMLRLIHDDDPVVAATAIDVVRELQIWALEPDLEYVLAHRDPRDWFVFEAASWTLAAHRLGFERRRALWLEPMPAAALVKRLRRLPMFASVGIDELFRLAATGHQVRHDTGTALVRAGAVPESLHVVLDGALVAVGPSGTPRHLPVPAAVGFEEVLEGLPMIETIRTDAPSVSLVLSSEDVLTLLAESPDLVEGLFRMLLTQETSGQPLVLHRQETDAELLPLAEEPLTPIQKAFVLQRIPVFSRVSAVEMRHLASIARQVPLEAGMSQTADGMGSAAVAFVLSGRVTVEVAGRPGTGADAGPGDTIGLYEALAGLDLVGPARATQLSVVATGSALVIARDDLFDLLSERSDLLQQIFGALFAGLPSGASVAAPA